MNLFYKSLEILKRNKKNIAYIGLFFLFMYLSTDISFAKDETVQTTTIKVLDGLVKAAGALLGMLTFLVGLFLYPGWTSGSVIGLADPLKTMWIMISNIVYFVFAFIFIWIAFMNVIGKEGDHYQLKQAIPRFIVGVIMVPFSWFLVQFVISLSSILSVAVLSLPYDTFKDSTFFGEDNLKSITFCKNYVVNMGNNTGSTNSEFPISCSDKNSTITLNEIINPNKSESLYGIMAFYTYGVMSLDENGRIFRGDVMGGVDNIFKLGLKMIFDILFIIIYLILMVALALVLFVRGVMLWLFAMFSPVFGLLYFFKKTGEGMGEGASKNFSIKELINLAFVPVYVAGALSFGMLFLFVAGQGFSSLSTNPSSNTQVINVNSGTVKLGDISYTFSGAFSSANAEGTKKLITGFQGSFGTMLLELFGLGILWMAVMAAVHHSKITASVAEPFEKFGGEIGGLIKKLPTFAPIIPTPGGFMSPQGMASAGGTFRSTIDSSISSEGSKIGQRAAGKLGFGESDNMLKELRAMTVESYSGTESIQHGITKMLGVVEDDKLSNLSHRKAIGDVLKKLGAEDSLIKKIEVEGKNKDILAKILYEGRNQWNDGSKTAADLIFSSKTKEQVEGMIGVNAGKSSGGSGGATSRTPEVVVESRHSVITGGKEIGKIHVKKEGTKISIAPETGAAMKITLNTDGTYSKILGNSQDIQGIKDLMEKSGVKKEDVVKVLEKIFSTDQSKELYKKMYP